MTERKHNTRECKYFYWDRDEYPICGKHGLCCTPTEDEKCPEAIWKDEDDQSDE